MLTTTALLVLYTVNPSAYLSIVTHQVNVSQAILFSLTPLEGGVLLWDGQGSLNLSTSSNLSLLAVLFCLLSLSKKGEANPLEAGLLLGSGLIIVSEALVLVAVAIEIQSYGTYLLLMSLSRIEDSYGVTTYFLFGSGGTLSILIAWGLASRLELSVDTGANLGLSIKLLGVGVIAKLGLAPFHMWLCTSYNGLKLEHLVWVSVMPLVPLFFVLDLASFSITATWLVAMASILLGGLGTVTEVKLKGFFALSGTSNVGLGLLGKGLGITNAIPHLALYSFSTILLVVIALNGNSEWGVNSMGQTKGLPGENLALTISLFGLIGIPPLFGFFTKGVLIIAILILGSEWAAVLAVFASLLATVGYLRLVMANLTYQASDSLNAPTQIFSTGQSLALSSTIAWVTFAGTLPFPLLYYT